MDNCQELCHRKRANILIKRNRTDSHKYSRTYCELGMS